jgi:hypothetical protein
VKGTKLQNFPTIRKTHEGSYEAGKLKIADSSPVKYLPNERCNLFHRGAIFLTPDACLPSVVWKAKEGRLFSKETGSCSDIGNDERQKILDPAQYHH